MLAKRFVDKIMSEIADVIMNGDPDQRYPGELRLYVTCYLVICDLFSFFSIFVHLGCINLSFAYVEGESLLMALKDVALSSGRSVVKKQNTRKLIYLIC